MSRVIEINDVEQLASYALWWRMLLAETPEANFFQSLAWLECRWRQRDCDDGLRVLVVESDERPLGILPLVIQRRATAMGSLRVLTYPLDDWGSFFGPIGPNPTATLMAGMGHIRRTPRDWDLLDMRWIDAAGRDHGRHATAMRFAGLPPVRRVAGHVALVDTSASWDEYWAGLSSKRRNNYRRSERKLAEHGRVEYLRYRPAGAACGDDDPRWDLYEACERVAGHSWQAQAKRGTTMSHASIRDFLREAHLAAVRAGGLDLNMILVDRRPVAFAYNYHFRGYVSGLRTGFHAAVRDGAGTVMCGRMLRDSFERDDHTVDLGADYLSAKRYWQTAVRPVCQYSYYPPSAPLAQIVRVKRRIDDWLHGDDAAGARNGARQRPA